MDRLDRLRLDDLAAIAARHKEQREANRLSRAELSAMVGHWLDADGIACLERQGKVPNWNHALYFSSLAVRTELDVLYILCGEHFPVHLQAQDKALWALLMHLSPTARASIYEQAKQQFDLEWDANEDVQLCVQHGERYRGIPIGVLCSETRMSCMAELRAFVDEALDEGLAQYLSWLRYDRNGVCQFGLVDGFVQESDEARRLAGLASMRLSHYELVGVYMEKQSSMGNKIT